MQLHHVGIVVSNLEDDIALYQKIWDLDVVSEIFTDPIQKVRVQFLDSGANTSIELIEAGGPGSPVMRYTQQGGGLHHLCYEVDDIKSTINAMETQGAIVVCQPVPAVAFQGRHIAFLVSRNRILTELLEISQFQ